MIFKPTILKNKSQFLKLYAKVLVTFTFIFQCGIVLADTPGIGENEFLETYLMEYISENNILGFIYIIFSDSAGGVQEDRVSSFSKLNHRGIT